MVDALRNALDALLAKVPPQGATLEDKDGYLTTANNRGRQFVAIRGPELRALERSGNPSLTALAKRVREAIEKSRLQEIERIEKAKARQEASAGLAEKHRERMANDPEYRKGHETASRALAAMMGVRR